MDWTVQTMCCCFVLHFRLTDWIDHFYCISFHLAGSLQQQILLESIINEVLLPFYWNYNNNNHMINNQYGKMKQVNNTFQTWFLPHQLPSTTTTNVIQFHCQCRKHEMDRLDWTSRLYLFWRRGILLGAYIKSLFYSTVVDIWIGIDLI